MAKHFTVEELVRYKNAVDYFEAAPKYRQDLMSVSQILVYKKDRRIVTNMTVGEFVKAIKEGEDLVPYESERFGLVYKVEKPVKEDNSPKKEEVIEKVEEESQKETSSTDEKEPEEEKEVVLKRNSLTTGKSRKKKR
jgi:hypothetical protein